MKFVNVNLLRKAKSSIVIFATLLAACDSASPYRELSLKSLSLSESLSVSASDEAPDETACNVPDDFELDDFDIRRHIFESDSDGGVLDAFDPWSEETKPLVDRYLHWPIDPERRNGFGDTEDHQIDLVKYVSSPGFGWTFRYIMDGYLNYAAKWGNGYKDPCPLNLLFYFNGGLNSREDIEIQAAKQIPLMLRDGYYPVFFIWDTEPFDSYFEQTSEVDDGWRKGGYLRKARTPLILLGDIVSGYARAPNDWITHATRYWQPIDPCVQLVGYEHLTGHEHCSNLKDIIELSGSTLHISESANELAPTRITAIIDSDRKHIVHSSAEEARNDWITSEAFDTVNGSGEDQSTLPYLLWTPVRVALATPLARGLGKPTWDNFLRRTLTTIQRPVDVTLRNLNCSENREEHQRRNEVGTGAFSRFFTRLELITGEESEIDAEFTCAVYTEIDEQGQESGKLQGDFKWKNEFDEKTLSNFSMFTDQHFEQECNGKHGEELYECLCKPIVSYQALYDENGKGYSYFSEANLREYENEIKENYIGAARRIEYHFNNAIAQEITDKENNLLPPGRFIDAERLKGYCHDWNGEHIFGEFYAYLRYFFNEKRPAITLIGHSMGGIVINELVSRFPDVPYRDVVVMASAASSQDTKEMLEGYFDKEKPDKRKKYEDRLKRDRRFYSLMLHPLNDDRELTFHGIPPSGSLLRWIDESYEPPKTPHERVFGYWPNAVSNAKALPSYVREGTFFRVFNKRSNIPLLPTESLNPVKHGDFNNTEACFWRPTFWGAVEDDSRYAHLNWKMIRDHKTCPCGVVWPDQSEPSGTLSYKYKKGDKACDTSSVMLR